jgi:hypothetical protein
MKVHKMNSSTERHETCQSAQKLKISKKDLALQIACLPFKRDELKCIWKMRRDVKQFIKTGVITNDKLDTLFDTVLKRFK